MFDFDSLPTFTHRAALWQRAGVRFPLVSLAINWMLLYAMMVGLFPWLGVMVGADDLRQVWLRTRELACLWWMLLPMCVATGYVAYVLYRLGQFRRRDPEYVLFTDSGSRLLTRGDRLIHRVRQLKSASIYFYKKHPRDSSAPYARGSFEEWNDQRLTTEWYAVRKAAWDLHHDQQALRATIPHRA